MASGNNEGTSSITIAVLGLGHVGLPTALGLMELGWEVTGADCDSQKIALIQAGRAPFHEPGLQELLTKQRARGKVKVTDDIAAAVRSAQVLFLCVGTPQQENGEADLCQVEELARTIARNLNGYKLIVEKSTVPVITANWIEKTIRRYARAGGNYEAPKGMVSSTRRERAFPAPHFDVASNPEFLQEGSALRDFFRPHRVVCGVETDAARQILEQIYRPLNCRIVITDVRTAELIKHTANAFLATKISFINMVSELCEAVGADVSQVAQGIGLDPRIGPDFLKAGIGFGGYCLPKDLRAFIHLAAQCRVDFSLLKEVERINQRREDSFLARVRQTLWVARGKTLAVLGLAFKPGTDDVRESPSLKIISRLLHEGAILRLYDPQAMPNTQRLLPEEPGRLTYCSGPYEAARGADALLLLTEWHEFRELDWVRLRDLMALPVLIDGRNDLDLEQVRQAGFEYVGMGRPLVQHIPSMALTMGPAVASV